MWLISGDAATMMIEFLVDGDFVTPTSAVATVRNQQGDILLTEALSVDSTEAPLGLSGAINTLAPESTVEYRYVTVSFIYEGKTYTRRLNYHIIPFTPLSVTEDDVRGELGLDSSELPDRHIDITGAYLSLSDDYGVSFQDNLLQGNVNAVRANRAVAIKAAISVIQSVRLRAAMRVTSEEQTFQRFADLDLVELERQLSRKLAGLIDALIPSLDTTFVFGVITPTDPITGS